MKRIRSIFAMTALVAALPLASAHATVIDKTFLEEGVVKNYTGPQNDDLDILSADVIFDGVNFILSATMNGAVGITAGGVYVWGFDRGGATNHPFIGIDNELVSFDASVRVNGTSRDVTIGGVSVGTAKIDGNSFTAIVSASLDALKNNGRIFADYTWNLWTVSPPNGTLGNPNTNTQAIADFAPNNRMQQVSVPEPASLTLIGLGLCALGFVFVHRKRREI